MRAEAPSEASKELAVLDKQRLKVWDFGQFTKSCEFGWHRRVKYARRTHIEKSSRVEALALKSSRLQGRNKIGWLHSDSV